MFFRKVIIGFFAIFIVLMLFIFFIRLSNNKTGFLGFSDLVYYFETSNIDFYYPIKRLSNDCMGIVRDFQSFITGIAINNPWDAIVVAVQMLGKIFKLLYIPVVAVFDLVRMIVDYIAIFANFINFIISFDGYPAISFT